MPQVKDLLEGKYRLIRKLGEGGMGEVFEARNELIGKRVAIKFLYRTEAEDELAIARFIQEARAAAAIGHRSIIDIYDTGKTSEGHPFLVMEFLRGEDLGQVLEREVKLDISPVTYLASKVLSALDATHAEGIVHRDIKPDNIFLLEGRQDLPEVKLLDFGVSKMVDPTRVDHKLTRSGVLIGSPMYMAPEQVVDGGSIDNRVDLYAMGIILHECLTGRMPFIAQSIPSLMYKIIHESPVSPREHNPLIPRELEVLILRAMAKDRDERFQTAQEMLGALAVFVDEPIRGRISFPERVPFAWSSSERETPIAQDSDEWSRPTDLAEEVVQPQADSPVKPLHHRSDPGGSPSRPDQAAAAAHPSTWLSRQRVLIIVLVLLLGVGAVALLIVGSRGEQVEDAEVRGDREAVAPIAATEPNEDADVEPGRPIPDQVEITPVVEARAAEVDANPELRDEPGEHQLAKGRPPTGSGANHPRRGKRGDDASPLLQWGAGLKQPPRPPIEE
jgi:serine/threonine-protein kinase